jgi:hypothetical protein
MKRRDFIGRAGVLLGVSSLKTKLTGVDRLADALDSQCDPKILKKAETAPLLDCYPPLKHGKQATAAKFKKSVLTDYKPFAAHEKKYAFGADFVVGISEVALNKFLAAHFKDNPDFYDRGRDKGSPIFQYDFDDHGTTRTLKLFAKVVKDDDKPALILELLDGTSPLQKRFEAWWRLEHGKDALTKETQTPPNVRVCAPHVVLQLDFPKLNPKSVGDVNMVDLNFTMDVAAFVSLADDPQGNKILKLTDWDIYVTPTNDPLDPKDAIWGPVDPKCEDELMALRLKLRDAFTFAANIALRELSRNLVQALPLPPINVVNGLNIVPREMLVIEKHIAFTAALVPASLSERIRSQFEKEVCVFNDALNEYDVTAVLSEAPTESYEKFEGYLTNKLPPYKALKSRNHALLETSRAPGELETAKAPVPSNDFFVMISSNAVDTIAKQLLKVNLGDCTPWAKLDVGVAYLEGRACYWFVLAGAHGAINGTTISMGCDVNAGGVVQAQACIRVPCASDQCASYTVGLGLKGPLGVHVTISQLSWQNNKAVMLNPGVDDFPGLVVYGLPPVLGDLVNLLLNWVTSAFLTLFLNAIVSSVHIPLFAVPVKLDQANVTLTMKDFGIANVDQMLTVTGTTDFD